MKLKLGSNPRWATLHSCYVITFYYYHAITMVRKRRLRAILGLVYEKVRMAITCYREDRRSVRLPLSLSKGFPGFLLYVVTVYKVPEGF